MNLSRLINNAFIIYLGCLLLILYNYWFLSARGYFNTVSPTLNVENVDFYAYYNAGKAYQDGLDPYIKNPSPQLFIYPPTYVPLFSLLARLDYQKARQTWLWIYGSIFIFTAGLFVSRLERQDRIISLMLFGVIIGTSYPLRYLIRQGQIDLVIASLIFASLFFYLKNHKTISAILLAVSVLTKVNPILLLITYCLFLFDWKYFVRFFAAVSGFIVLSTLFFPFEWYITYLRVLSGLTLSKTHIYNQTLILFVAGHPYLPRVFSATGIVLLACFAIFAGRRVRRVIEFDSKIVSGSYAEFMLYAFFLLNMVVALMLSGTAWIMAYVWFILPIIPIALYILRNGRSWFAALVGLSIFGFNATIYELPGVTYLPLFAGMALALGLCLLLLKPELALQCIPVEVNQIPDTS